MLTMLRQVLLVQGVVGSRQASFNSIQQLQFLFLALGRVDFDNQS